MPHLVFRLHALQRMFQRKITGEDVRGVPANGEVIEDYPNDTPYPSRLLLGWTGTRPLHVVAADNAVGNEIIIVTAYEPDPLRWSADWKTRQ